MKIFNGKKVAQKILKEVAQEVKRNRLSPVLAVVLVGENEESKLYIKLKKKAGAGIGIKVEEYFFSGSAKQEEIIGKIQELNNDRKISGIIVQLPLPAILNPDKIIGAIDPFKDVDGFHPANRQLLKEGKPNFMPVLPQAILHALGSIRIDLKDKKNLALVNSEIFGETLKAVFKNDDLNLDYIVRKTCIVLGIEKEVKSADILIFVCGCPNFIKGDMIKEGAILIDAGMTRFHDNRVVGDVDRESVKGKVSFLTPVPGGIGPLTVALLLKNVFLAAKFENQKQ